MPKPNIAKISAAVGLLAQSKGPTENEIARVAPCMGNWQTVSTGMSKVPQNKTGLATLRAMLAHELAREEGPRDMIVYRVVARHEQLSKTLRFAAMAKALPIAAGGLRRSALA